MLCCIDVHGWIFAGAREQTAVELTPANGQGVGAGGGRIHDASEQKGLPFDFIIHRASMPFLLAMDLPAGSQVPFQTNPQLPLDPIQLAVPLELKELEVESFDPVARAAELAESLPRHLVRHV